MNQVVDDLGSVLAATLDLVRASLHEGFAQHRTTEQIALWLEGMVTGPSGLAHLDRAAVRLAFAPTGELQELSIANDWIDEYLALAARCDALLDGA